MCVCAGCCFWEATLNDEGIGRVGWSTRYGSFNLGTDAQGFGFGGTGKKSNSRKFEDYGRAYGKGDVIGWVVCARACDVCAARGIIDQGFVSTHQQHRKKL